ncbi:hypothetical protein GCM10009119_28060 [Algoriphagus jejuensis]|uniref:Cytochrome c domain-containing protein n=1 Tax=Algoriphagus jejuensis TaxID=419934 RepID=A0ABN1N2G3_9BACT
MSPKRTEMNSFLPDSPVRFRRMWVNCALGFFFIAALIGLTMRAFPLWDIPYFDYRNLLHTHSHIALLGWGFLMLSGGIVFSLASSSAELRRFTWLFVAAVISILGMLFSFPFQGYGGYSIAFSSLHVLVSYGFIYQIHAMLRKENSTPGIRLIRLAIWSQLVSTFGLWALGPVNIQLGKMHEFSLMCVQWFLHFQLNGWMVFGVLGLIFIQFEKSGHSFRWAKYQEMLLLASLILTYALAVTWAAPSPLAFQVNSLAVILQFVAYFFLMKAMFEGLRKVSMVPMAKLLLQLAAVSLLLKASFQLLLVLPSVAVISYTIRMYVIGFLHLVLLGVMSFGVFGLAVQKDWLPNHLLTRLGLWFLIAGFSFSELLLFGQGTLVWMQLGFLEHYHVCLFLASGLLPIGLGLLMIQVFTFKIPLQKPIKNQINFKTNKTLLMKSALLWSLGISMMLLTACGGSSEQTAASSESATASPQAASSDPKGIGEVKSVDLGTGINPTLAEEGQAIVDMKCTACHQLNDKRLVGPGFQGVTNRRRPEWIINMITNVDVMLDQDATAQKLLEECLTRMPNQNLSQADARGILEFMRRNDEEKAGQRDAAVN